MSRLALLLVTLLAIPIAHANEIPLHWSATGAAQWLDASATCEGQARATAWGPLPTGAHAGQYALAIHLAPTSAGCAAMDASGYVRDPRVDTATVLSERDGIATIVAFATHDDGSRELSVLKVDESSGDDVALLAATAAIVEQQALI